MPSWDINSSLGRRREWSSHWMLLPSVKFTQLSDFLNAKGIEPNEIHCQLTEVWGELCMDVNNIHKSCTEFRAGHTEIHDRQRIWRPSTSNEAVTKVRQTTHEDRRISLNDLSSLVSEVSRSAIHKVLMQKLQYWKLCARWVPRILPEDHKWRWVDSTRKFLHRYADEKDKFLDSAITGDETWMFYFTAVTKQQSHDWWHPFSPNPQEFKQMQSASKVTATMFWDLKEGIAGQLYAFWGHNKCWHILKKSNTGNSEQEKRNAEQGHKHSLQQHSPTRHPSNCRSLATLVISSLHHILYSATGATSLPPIP